MTWDQICSDFETLSLNWDPALFPNTATRHWTWPKPPSEEDSQISLDTSPRYRLRVRGDQPGEICILLSQHTTSKDRPLDDIALHVFEEQQAGGSSRSRVLHPHRVDSSVSPSITVRHSPPGAYRLMRTEPVFQQPTRASPLYPTSSQYRYYDNPIPGSGSISKRLHGPSPRFRGYKSGIRSREGVVTIFVNYKGPIISSE